MRLSELKLPKTLTTHDFENVMFGDIKKNPEKDTKIEKYIFDMISNYIRSGFMPEKRKLAGILKKLQQLKNEYSVDLQPPKSYLYRGLNTKREFYKMATSKKKVGKNPVKIKTTYKPKSQIESWTSNERIAKNFMDENDYRYPGVIKVRSPDDSFILNPKLTNVISNEFLGEQEYEVLRVSTQPIDVEVILYPHNIKNYLYDLSDGLSGDYY